MFKKISVFLLATAMLLSVPACSMPDNIFADGIQDADDQIDSNSMSDIYDFEFTLGGQEFQLPVNYSAISSRGWKISEAAESATEDQDTETQTETQTETERPFPTLENSIVNVSLTMTFYETIYGATNLDGLIVEKVETPDTSS